VLHIVLDTGVLGLAIHPSTKAEPRDCKEWLRSRMRQGDVFYIPEVVDYELRRELLHLGFADSVARLDELKSAVGYMPITTATMLKAAELWASARRAGIPTADVKALDVDMILSAHTILLGALVGSAPIVATTNVRHLSQFVDARRWQDIV